MSRIEAWLAVPLDLGCVVGDTAVTAPRILRFAEKWAVATVADFVRGLALLQFASLRRLVRAGQV